MISHGPKSPACAASSASRADQGFRVVGHTSEVSFPLTDGRRPRPEAGFAGREAEREGAVRFPQGGGSWGNHGCPHVSSTTYSNQTTVASVT